MTVRRARHLKGAHRSGGLFVASVAGMEPERREVDHEEFFVEYDNAAGTVGVECADEAEALNGRVYVRSILMPSPLGSLIKRFMQAERRAAN